MPRPDPGSRSTSLAGLQIEEDWHGLVYGRGSSSPSLSSSSSLLSSSSSSIHPSSLSPRMGTWHIVGEENSGHREGCNALALRPRPTRFFPIPPLVGVLLVGLGIRRRFSAHGKEAWRRLIQVEEGCTHPFGEGRAEGHGGRRGRPLIYLVRRCFGSWNPGNEVPVIRELVCQTTPTREKK